MTTELTPDAEQAIALAHAVIPTIQPWQDSAIAAIVDGHYPTIVLTNRTAARTHRNALELIRRNTTQALAESDKTPPIAETKETP